MDYKEKYEQALERARQFSEKPYLEDSAGIVEYIFPELKESEDEKVEKVIFGMVYDSDDELWSSYGVSKSDVLAWLEKQGEQKSQEEVVDNLHNYLYNERKPVEWSEEDECNMRRIIRVLEDNDSDWNELTAWLKSLKDRCIPQTKQEWSEKEKEKINSICNIVADKRNLQKQDYKSYYNSLIDFLKSLRHQSHKKEWQEIDEYRRRQINRIVKDSGASNKLQEEIKEWLNTLVPQKQWKPSEYEIQLLKDVASGVKDPVAYGASMGVIIGGLEQLKAL